MPCLPPTSPCHPGISSPPFSLLQPHGDNRPIRLSLPLGGFQIPSDLHAPAPRRCDEEAEAANEGAHLAAHIGDLDMLARSAPLPRRLCNPGGTSGILGAGGEGASPSPSQGCTCRVLLPSPRFPRGCSCSLWSVVALPKPTAGGLRRGAPTPRSCPHPFAPRGNDPRGKRSRGCWQPPRPAAQLCSGKGMRPSGTNLNLSARNTGSGQQGTREGGGAAVEYSSTASLTSSSLAAAFFKACFPRDGAANLARGRSPRVRAEEGCKWDTACYKKRLAAALFCSQVLIFPCVSITGGDGGTGGGGSARASTGRPFPCEPGSGAGADPLGSVSRL